jgi:hypothetical protein
MLNQLKSKTSFSSFKKFGQWSALLCAGAFGFFIFACTGGLALLDPHHYTWLIGGDSSSYFFGFNFFNQETWHFPLGLIERFSAPEHSSIVYTDSIPWVAFLLKSFSIQSIYQYQGIWMAMCFVLQGMLGYRLCHQKTGDASLSLIGSVFFSTLPSFLMRGHEGTRHYSLLAHFLILLTFSLSLEPSPGAEQSSQKISRSFIQWSALLFLALGIHFYLFLIVMLFFIAHEFPKLSVPIRKVTPRYGVLALGLLGVSYLLGYFSIPLANSTAGGFGIYSMNLNAIFNNGGFGILPSLRFLTPDQFEGYQYLGLGLLLAIAFWCRPRSFKTLSPSLQFVFLFLLLFALSFKLSCSALMAPEMFTVPLYAVLFAGFFRRHRKSLSQSIALALSSTLLLFIFGKIARASGRMFWPIEYFLVLSLIAAKPKKWILLSLLALQLWDLSPMMKNLRTQNRELSRSPLPLLDFAENLRETHLTHIALQDPNSIPQKALLYYALENHLSIGPVTLARASSQFRRAEQDELAQRITTATLSPQVLYLVGDQKVWEQYQKHCSLNLNACASIVSSVSPSGLRYLYLK